MEKVSFVGRNALSLALLLLSVGPAFSLETFKIPEHWEDGVHALPQSSRPWTYWYWMNGRISKQGITDDLEAMKRGGLGGAMIFNISGHIHAGNIDYEPVKIYSPEWRDLMKHAITEGKRVGIEIILNNSMSGWSSSGGPWITPEYSMRKLTWSETQVTGENKSIKLPAPPSLLDSYEDVAVLAFPTPASELPLTPPAKVSASDPGFETAAALENPTLPPGGSNWDAGIKPNVRTSLRTKENEEGFVQWVFQEGIHTASLHLNYLATLWRSQLSCEAFTSHDKNSEI